jgi:CheY-like chemotaxis protein
MRAETAQRTAAEDARLANQAKTRFLSNMSHEIRTPLGVIQGFADLALDESIPELERHEYLLTIKRNAHSLTKLLGEILDLSKIEADKIEIEKTRFSLTEVVQDVISALSLQAKEKGIGLSFRSEQPFPEFITSDPTRIRQIFINLISNAIKFTSHGHVEVVARLRKNLNPYQTSYIEFNVKDTGIGLTEEQKLRLFQAFSQADSSTTRKFGGTGLGLSLSKKLAYILGGDLILVESQIDEGSTFQFFFDAGILQPTDYRTISSSVSSFSAHIPVVSDELLGLNILLVEDSIDNQMLFSKYLTRFGASVDVASDGMEGVERARKSSYDVILMDVQMPNLDGYGAVSALHSAGITTPILALTAHATKDERDRAMNSGFSGYLTKPLSQIQLLEALSKYNKK